MRISDWSSDVCSSDLGGREHILAAGDSIFVRGSEVSAISCQSRTRFTNIAIALDDLRAFYSGADDLAMRVVPRQSDLLGLLHAYVAMLRPRAAAAAGAAGGSAASRVGEGGWRKGRGRVGGVRLN